jgi:hydroxymethylbilane synthase
MSASRRVAVGSRNSPLSRVQTDEILAPLRKLHPDVTFDFVPISTGGDRDKSAPLLSLGRGIFVKEIEARLLNGDIDFAVHSAKDVPALLPEGLELAALGPRQDPRDVIIDRWSAPFAELPEGACIGTSSPRRAAQLKSIRPDLEIKPIRGNVGTRVDKASSDEYDGVVLAAAGLLRLGMGGRISGYLSPDICTPDAGQGALAVEARASDDEILELLATVDHGPTNVTVTAERAFVEAVGGGCQVPVAAYATLDGAQLRISAMAATPDGSRLFRTQTVGAAEDPVSAGRAAAEALMRTEAATIIARGPSA